MGKLVKNTGKPVLLHSLYNFAKPHSLELLRYYDIPVYDSLDIACKCIAVLSQYGHYSRTHHAKANFVFNWGSKANKEGQSIIARAKNEGRDLLFEYEGKELLQLHGAPVSLDRLAEDADNAVKIAQDLGGKVALKIVSPDILHKSDAGGVELNLETEDEIRNAFHRITERSVQYKKKAQINGCIVSRMAGEGVEIIIGTKIDDQFGPVIMFGIGGILVEVLKDVSFRVLPISRTAPKKMVSEIRSFPILNGVRGRPPVDKQAIYELLLTVSEVVEAYPQIQEMDLNPVIAHEDGITIVDARIILKKEKTIATGIHLI